jgi:hypothetical protein
MDLLLNLLANIINFTLINYDLLVKLVVVSRFNLDFFYIAILLLLYNLFILLLLIIIIIISS